MKYLALATLLALQALVFPSPVTADDEAQPTDFLERLGAISIEMQAAKEYREAVPQLRQLLSDIDAALAEIEPSAARLDLELVRAQIRWRQFEVEELRLFELIPNRYLRLGSTNNLFTRPCALPDGAVRKAVEELKQLPEVLRNGRANLKSPARVWTENAISNSRYASRMLEEEIRSVCVDDTALQKELLAEAASAAEAVASYRSWLEDELLPKSDRSPAWKPEQVEVYQFEVESLHAYGVDEMIRIASEDEAETMAAMQELAQRIHPSGDLRTVWELMKDETPPWAEVPAMATRYVELAAAWLKGEGSHLVEIPERFDYGVQITSPMGRRVLSFGGATYGPTIGGRISGYYVLTPLEPWLSEQEAASRLRSYNPYWTHVISYHEWLGHNVQRAVAHEFADTPVRRQFNGIYLSQAWSFYLEKLLEDEGYFEDVLPHMEALKTRMARLQMRMWRIQRILTKLGMAKDTMTFEQAVEAYVEKIGMEPTNAFIEVQRDSQSPSPPGREIIGERVILEMRDEYWRRMGEHATLRGFHEALLRYGNLPLPVVRQLMFGDF